MATVPYQEAVGCLVYLAQCTRSDILFGRQPTEWVGTTISDQVTITSNWQHIKVEATLDGLLLKQTSVAVIRADQAATEIIAECLVKLEAEIYGQSY